MIALRWHFYTFLLIFFIRHKWIWGCIFYSIGVSIKMNVLLFAPPLLLLMLKELNIIKTILNLLVCAIIQVAFALPFIQVNLMGYLQRSFDLGRQFMYKWTVNLKFLPEPIFLNKNLAIGLLALHLSILLAFLFKRWSKHEGGILNIILYKPKRRLTAEHMVTLLFTGNFIGIACSRSLHYQFYSWYFHTLPYLLFTTKIPLLFRIILLIAIEISWNTYPATALSSGVLLICHLIILLALWFSPVKPSFVTAKSD